MRAAGRIGSASRRGAICASVCAMAVSSCSYATAASPDALPSNTLGLGDTAPGASAPGAGREPATPRIAAAPDVRDEGLLQLCGEGDATLHHAARHVAARALEGKRPLTMVELGGWLRAWSEPHPGARAWTIKGSVVDRTHAIGRLRQWLAKQDESAPRRCGVANVQDSEHGEALAVVTVPVFADLQMPVPRTLPQGRWVTVDARMMQWADAAKVVVLGPRGAPRTIPTSYDPRQRRIVGRFMADRQGTWLVQVLATTRTGPRPVLESEVRVGEAVEGAPVVVPGENAGKGLSDADAMFAKLNEARRSEGLQPLKRDPILDSVAENHVRQMMKAGIVAHDVGDGTPPERAAEAGVSSSEVGENVSRAKSTNLAHRALWDSPSHRTNTLYPRYMRVGVSAARDAQGRVWVAQVFAGREMEAR
jgi:uncharacterized protein YkwD